MERAFGLSKIRTTTYAWAAILIAGLGWALDAVTSPLWSRFGIHANSLEILGAGLFWFAYAALCLLLPISAFRPETRFYTHGDCSLRAKRFATVLALFVVANLFIVAAIAFAFGGGRWQ